MYDNIERELKLLVDEKVYNELLHSYDFHNPITQTNTYFDTDNQDVKKQHGAVRIRTIQDKKIFTLKIRKDEYTHYEFEKEITTENINDIIEIYERCVKIPVHVRHPYAGNLVFTAFSAIVLVLDK